MQILIYIGSYLKYVSSCNYVVKNLEDSMAITITEHEALKFAGYSYN